jgi:hypothetical protein
MTCPAAAEPVWPWTSTIRVEATLRPSRNSVANSSTVGKDEKSSGFSALSATISTARLIVMFMMKNTSSRKAGIGTTIRTTSSRIAAGSAPWRAWARIFIG